MQLYHACVGLVEILTRQLRIYIWDARSLRSSDAVCVKLWMKISRCEILLEIMNTRIRPKSLFEIQKSTKYLHDRTSSHSFSLTPFINLFGSINLLTPPYLLRMFNDWQVLGRLHSPKTHWDPFGWKFSDFGKKCTFLPKSALRILKLSKGGPFIKRQKVLEMRHRLKVPRKYSVATWKSFDHFWKMQLFHLRSADFMKSLKKTSKGCLSTFNLCRIFSSGRRIFSRHFETMPQLCKMFSESVAFESRSLSHYNGLHARWRDFFVFFRKRLLRSADFMK